LRSKTFTIILTALFLVAAAGGSMVLVLNGYQAYSQYSNPYSYVPVHPASSIAGMGMTPLVNHTVIFVLDGVRADTFYKTDKPSINGYHDWANWTDVQCSTLISASKIGFSVISSGCNSSESTVISNDYVGLFKGDSLWNVTVRHSGTTALVGSSWWYDLFNPYLNYSVVFAESVPGKPTTAVNVTNKGTPVETPLPDYRDSLVSQYAQSIVQKYKPTFMVVHFVETDEAAHANGSLSQSYVNAFKNEDTYIGQILNKYQSAGILNSTLVVVLADHGHVDTGGHGGIEPEVLHIPLILRGPGVIPGTYGTHQHQNTVAPTVSALMGWEVPSDASGPVLFQCLNLNSTQQAIYRIDLASIRYAQTKITLEKMGYLACYQPQMESASRYLDNARGNFTAANYSAATNNAITSESISSAELASSWASKQTEEITGRLLPTMAILVVLALVMAFLIHRYRDKVGAALVRERDFAGVAVVSVALYFLFLAITTALSGAKFSPSYFPDSVTAFILSVFVPTLMAMIPTGIVFVLLIWYVGHRTKATDATLTTYSALFVVLTTVIYISIITAVVVVNTSGLPWYAPDVILSIEFFYLIISGVAFALFGLVSFLVALGVIKILGIGKDTRK
jgi:hypothetical protein